MFAVVDRSHHQLTRRLVAADQFDDNGHLRLIYHREGVLADGDPIEIDAGEVRLPRRGVGDANTASGAARDLLLIA